MVTVPCNGTVRHRARRWWWDHHRHHLKVMPSKPSKMPFASADLQHMLPWKAEPGRKSSATPNHEAYHLFHPFSPTLWFPPCLFASAAAEVHPTHWRHLDAAKIYISQTRQGVLYMSPAVPQGRQGGVNTRKYMYSSKEQKKKEKMAWRGSAALSQPEHCIFVPAPPSANLLSPSATALVGALPPFLQLHRAQGSFWAAVRNATTHVPG